MFKFMTMKKTQQLYYCTKKKLFLFNYLENSLVFILILLHIFVSSTTLGHNDDCHFPFFHSLFMANYID